jgi:hypothetical protein
MLSRLIVCFYVIRYVFWINIWTLNIGIIPWKPRVTVFSSSFRLSVRKISPDSTLIEFFLTNTESTVYSILSVKSATPSLRAWAVIGYLLGYVINLVVDIQVCVPYTLSLGNINITGRHVEQRCARAGHDVALNILLTTIRIPSAIRLYIIVTCLHASAQNVNTSLKVCYVPTFRTFCHRGLIFVTAEPRINELLTYVANYNKTT